MTTRQELEKQGWIYMCCESPQQPENSKQLDEMGIPYASRKYIPAHELGGMNFQGAILDSLREGKYRAVFFKPSGKTTK